MAERDLVVRFIGDDRSLQQAFNRTERRTRQFDTRTQRLGNSLSSAFAVAGISLGAAAGVVAIKNAVTAASDLNETLSKSRQVFGAASVSVEQFGDSAATAIGLSKQQAIEAAATFGNLFRTVGLASTQNAEFSASLVKLAGDLASFNNVDPTEALVALRSGLIGEAEPLRRFGVLLSETRVQQEAMAATGKKSAEALTDQEKVLARYAIILRDTKTAQGDFTRTSEGLANQTRIAKANLSDFAANMGQTFLPAVNASVGALNDLFETNTLVARTTRAIRTSIKDSGLTMREALPALEEYRAGLAAIKGEADSLVQALDAIIGRQLEISHARADASRGEGRTAESVAQSNAAVDAAARKRREDARRNAQEGQADIDRIESEARQRSLSRQLADSRTRAAHLRDLIRADSDNVKLQQRLRSELDKQASLRGQIAAEAASTAASDKAAAEAAKAAADETARRRRENRVAARQRRQFAALGLTATGEERVPGIGALRRRGRNLIQELRGSGLSKQEISRFTNQISVIFSDQFDKSGRDVRQAILDMFRMIADTFQSAGQKLEGPLTKTSGLVTRKIAEGLGLTPEQERELRARLSHFNTGGRAPVGGQDRRTGAGFVGGQAFVIDNNVTVIIDGQKLTTTVTKQQQKAKRRNPRQKRGPARAGTGGH